MKIFDAILMARDMGLDTVGEAVYNIEIHANQLFSYTELSKELHELRSQYGWLLMHRRTPDGRKPITEDSSIQMLVKYHIGENMMDYEMNPSLSKRLTEEKMIKISPRNEEKDQKRHEISLADDDYEY